MDVAEAFAWGQKFLLGYGKHPPLSGWIAGMWFAVFPASDWATHLLAMTTVSCGLFICWLISRRTVASYQALLALIALAIYPIFNIKGYKYNADLLQLLLVLAYLNAFEKRTVRSGLRDLHNILHEMQGLSCGFVSLGESWCDTTTDVGRLMLTIMGGIAEFERGLIRKRTDEGIERAKKLGKKFGRPERLDAGQKRVIADRYGRGATIPELAEEYGVGVGTIWRALQPEITAAA